MSNLVVAYVVAALAELVVIGLIVIVDAALGRWLRRTHRTRYTDS